MSNFDDLNKHQLILLTLLVSFVTSIATGIITFSLLQEAPVEVTQTINRVVERTIERVATEEGGSGEVVREVQVVNEENLILESIEKNSKSVVRVKTLGFDGSEILVGLGTVVGDGVIVMDAGNFSQSSNYSIHFHDGKIFNVSKTHTASGFAFLKVGKPANETYKFHPATFGNPDGLKLGQSVIALAGKTSNLVTVGRVSQLEKDTSASATIITDIPKSKSLTGSPLLNLSGEIVGVERAPLEADTNLGYTSINALKPLIQEALTQLEN